MAYQRVIDDGQVLGHVSLFPSLFSIFSFVAASQNAASSAVRFTSAKTCSSQPKCRFRFSLIRGHGDAEEGRIVGRDGDLHAALPQAFSMGWLRQSG